MYSYGQIATWSRDRQDTATMQGTVLLACLLAWFITTVMTQHLNWERQLPFVSSLTN